MTSNNIYLRKQ